MVTFIITFICFPGPMLKHKVGSLATAWSAVIYLFSYNIGDTIGKYIA